MSDRRKKYQCIGGGWDYAGKHRGLYCDGKNHWNRFQRPKQQFWSQRCNCEEFMESMKALFAKPVPVSEYILVDTETYQLIAGQ